MKRDKKNIIFKFIIFILIFFIVPINGVKAEEAKFKIKNIDNKVVFEICNKPSITCHFRKEGEETTTNFKDGSIGFSDINSYYEFFIGEGSFEETKQALEYITSNGDYCDGNKDCFQYFQENYCSTSSDDPFCKYIKETSNEEQDVNGQKICKYTVKFRGESTATASFMITRSKDNKNITVADSNGIVDTSNNYYTAIDDRLFFYAKDGTHETFKEEYLKTTGCPTLAICDDGKSGSYNNWYSFVGTKEDCENSIYLGIYKQDTTGGISSGLELKDDISFDLIEKEPIEFDCDSLLKDGKNNTLFETIKTVVKIVKILVPIILLVLGSLDFAQAVFSGNEDGMKKAQSKFIKRLIIAVIIFLIPTFIELILRIANMAWPNIDPSLCGILD